jgi:arylsulfatase A-like enzyme
VIPHRGHLRSRRPPASRRAVLRGLARALLAVLLVAQLAACSRAPDGAPPGPALPATPRHLILVTVDTLRGDHTSLHGYPRETTPELDRWAERAVVFERAIAQWPKTGASLASMFTGRYPQSTGLTHKAAIRVPESLDVLPAMLQRQGFATVGVVSNAVLSTELGWDRGFDEYLETWGDELTEDPVEYRKLLWAGRVNELALPLLERHRDAERLFAWIHYSDPHAPYVLPPGFENPFLDDEAMRAEPHQAVDLRGTRGKAIGDHRELAFYRAQYDANVRVADAKIGELLQKLDDIGVLDDAVVVFTADHGESLGEHGSYFEHGPLPYNTTSLVPLFVLAPGRAPARRVADPVALVDLLPTLLEWLLPGVEHPPREGTSLLPTLVDGAELPARAGDRPLAFAEAGRPPRHFWSVQDRRWKLIFREPAAGRPASLEHYELYDLEADPLETADLAAADHPELARLRRLLGSWRIGGGQTATPAAPQGEEEIKALRALGYLDEEPGADRER